MSLVLDVNQDRIKIVVIRTKKNMVFVDKCIKKDLLNDTVKNGYLIDTSFSIFLKKVLKENNIHKKNCTLIINSTDIVPKELSVPITNKKQLFLLINNQIEENFAKMVDYSKDFTIIKKNINNFNEEEKIVQKSTIKKFFKIKKAKIKSTGTYNILAYAIPNDMIVSWYKAIKAAGLRPVKMELEQNCIAKIFNTSRINDISLDDKSVVSVYVTLNRIVINLIIDGINSYSRELDLNEDDLVTEVNKSDLSTYIDIEDTKASNDLLLYNKIINEIINLIQFSLSKRIRKPVSNVFIFGDLDNYSMIYEYMKKNLSTKVEIINSISNINIRDKDKIQDTIISAGSAMRWKL